MKIKILWGALFLTFIQSSFAAGGSVIAFGEFANPSITNVPPLTNVVSVSAGLSDALALRDDGTVVDVGRQ